MTNFVYNDLSIASTKTKYIKINTKTRNISCRLNENLMTFLYTLTGATRKQKEKKSFLFKESNKVECCFKKLGFSIYFYVFGFSRSNGLINYAN